MFSKLIILSLLAVLANAQIISLGRCPDVTVVQDFDVAGYLGQWYQITRFPNLFEFGDCSSALYGPVENGLVKVHNVEIRNGNESFVDGTAELADPNSTEAKLIVKFTNPDTIADYWVLGTDYTNYTVVWACQNIGSFNTQFAWVLARAKPLSEESTKAVEKILKDNSVNADKLEVHDLPQCTTLP